MSMETEAMVFADYVDGETARVRRVKVSVQPASQGSVVRIEPTEGALVDWPIDDVRRIPDQAAKDAVVYGLTGDHPARLIVKDARLNAELSAACPDLKRRHKDPNLLKRLMILSIASVASVALIVFVLVPIMADQLATMLPAEGEQALGDSSIEQIRLALDNSKATGLKDCRSTDGLAALAKMQARLSIGANLPYDIRLHVLDHKMINAFALPGGHIVLFEGLLDDAKNPLEVAGVLGHEMVHVEHRDPTRLALRSAGSVGVLGLLLGDFAGGAAVLFMTEKLIQAQYSQGAEAGSDTYAYALLAAAKLPTVPMADFFDRLHKKYGEEKGLMSHLASHPDSLGRSEAARAANTVEGDFVPILTADEWASLQAICD
jgi:beta-barrel assembly-enhancing protease